MIASFLSNQSLVAIFFAFNLLKVIFVGSASVFAALTMIKIARAEHWNQGGNSIDLDNRQILLCWPNKQIFNVDPMQAAFNVAWDQSQTMFIWQTELD